MSAPSGGGKDISVAQTVLQIVLTLAIFYFWSTPIIQPIKLLVVLLHEMSHGLMALASGGTVYDILITPDEGGACRSDGGNALLVASAGYLGSIFFGGMILRAARGGSAVPVTYALLAFLLLGAAVTVLHDPYSRTFAMSLAGFCIFLGLIAPSFIGAFGLRILGTGSCLYAIFDIYSDLLAQENVAASIENDAQTFSSITGIPQEAVGILWLILSILFFIAILKSSILGAPKPAPAPSGS